GANAEFGRSAGSAINVITKSGTNSFHGGVFEYFRTEGLTAATSDGKPLDNFQRNQFGGSIGGPIKQDKLFFFGATEGIRENLTRSNLSTAIGTACSITSPVFGSNITEAQINASPDCQRLTLLNFMKTKFNEDDGAPVDHLVRNASAFGRVDYNINSRNQVFGSYSYDWSKNTNQTFDVPTYGTTANGIEGPSKIQVVNGNWYSTISPNKLNEAHFTYSRENRPRNTADAKSVPDTAMGFGTTFRFGQPFFLEPSIDEIFWRTDVRDSFSLVQGKHTWKVGGEWIHSRNTQVFRGFFTGRYIFDGVVGFLRSASPAAANGFGPNTGECFSASGAFTGWITQNAPFNQTCPAGSSVGGPPLLYLQHGPTTASATLDQSRFSD